MTQVSFLLWWPRSLPDRGAARIVQCPALKWPRTTVSSKGKLRSSVFFKASPPETSRENFRPAQGLCDGRWILIRLPLPP